MIIQVKLKLSSSYIFLRLIKINWHLHLKVKIHFVVLTNNLLYLFAIVKKKDLYNIFLTFLSKVYI